MRRSNLAFAFAALVLAGPAWGQAVPSKEPSGTHMFPAGGRRGTVVPVRVGGECLPPGSDFHVWGAGVTAPKQLGPMAKTRYEPSPRRIPTDADNGEPINYPKEWSSKVTIAHDAPLGATSWRVTCGWGGTRPRPFIVGDLPEFVETEPNSDPDRAERVTLPVTVNGQVAGERDVDFFVFHAEKDAVVVCDVLAGRIGSPLDPVLGVRDPHGRRVPLQEIRVGTDPVLAFRATYAGDYTLNIANVSYRGGPEFVYRMTISTDPYPAFVFLTGKNSEAQLLALTGGDDFRTWTKKVPYGPSSPVTGNDSELTGAANHSAATAMPVSIPANVRGGFPAADAEDWYAFTAKKDQAFVVTCQPYSAASAACPVVALQDAAGKPVARASSADSADRGCRLEWKAPADGKYRLRVRDLQHGSRGGPDFLYGLSLRPARSGFAVTLAADYINVVQGGRADLDVNVDRTGGFTGPIDLDVRGLPPGLKLETARVPENATRFKLVLIASDDARPANAALTVRGKAINLSESVTARAATVGGPAGVLESARQTDALHLTVQHKPIFRLTCNEAYQYAHRGTVYPYSIQVERLNGFAGEITLQICDRQVQDLDGIEVVERVVPPGVKEIGAPVYLPETMHANAQHHSRPYVQGYASFTDKWGQKQAMLALCDKRCMIRAMPPVAKLKAADEQVTARPGETVACKLVLARTSHFTGPMDVELVDSGPGITLEKTRIEAGQTTTVAAVHVARGASIGEGRALRFRGTGRLPGDVTVISEATVEIHPK